MLLSEIWLLFEVISRILQHLQTLHKAAMTQTHTHADRTAPTTGSGINGLIAAANTNDRFRLLEDSSVPPADLNNSIHPIFCWFDYEGPLKQMLQLASQFLEHDTVLTFFIPLLYGRELTTSDSGPTRTYLSNSYTNATEEKRRTLLTGVREALHCLAHSLEFRFMRPEKRVYARTMTNTTRPTHTSTCCTVFQRKLTAKVEIADRFMHFYDQKDVYVSSFRCAQFRHDFLFATTLVHEIVHAVGVMRRGDLHEPFIRADHPDTEWGYAWEHFMFGAVFNPQDRTRSGTYLLMRKIWADPTVVDEAGGKEYCDISMAYIAQWFRTKTWRNIAKNGPTVIPSPTTHFKIQSSNKLGCWVVSSDCMDVKPDLVALHREWTLQAQKPTVDGKSSTTSRRIKWHRRTTEALQLSNVPLPYRAASKQPYGPLGSQIPSERKVATCKAANCTKVVTVRRSSSRNTGETRKRRAESVSETTRASKIIKR